MSYETLRNLMVEQQLLARDIKDRRVMEAFKKVERHKFLPEYLRNNAYADFPLPIEEGQTISQPYIVALMTQWLNLTGTEKVLEIGTGSGYQTAILAELAKEVYSLERFEILAKKARQVLDALGYANIRIKTRDGTLGWPEEAPFDRIIVTAAAKEVPLSLTEQLKENGRLIIPIGETFSQILTLIEKTKTGLNTTQICGCVFVPLVGKYGLKEKA